MKKTFMIAALALSIPIAMVSVSSCNVMKGMQAVSQISDVAQTASEVSNVLTNTLGLNLGQKTAVGSIISDYIGGTNGIAGLLKGKKASYVNQLSSLNFGTMGKLSKVLSAAQYLKLLNLGSTSKGNMGNLLGGLTGGNSLSSGAQGILAGLLLNKI